MRPFEKLAIAIRRSAVLRQAAALWNWVRPLYMQVLKRAASGGLERNINGTDLVLLTPELYSCSEIYEPQVWPEIMGSIRPGDTVADVGASIGLYTIAMAKRTGSQGHVYAFEPEPQTVLWLQSNVRLNHLDDRVQVLATVVGAEPGMVEFVDGRGSESHVATTASTTSSPESVCLVQALTLDSFFADMKLDILKIDVEGYEEAVLQGGANLLKDIRRAPRIVFIEVHPFAWPGFRVSSESILTMLSGYGYQVYDLRGRPVAEIKDYGEIIARKETKHDRERNQEENLVVS